MSGVPAAAAVVAAITAAGLAVACAGAGHAPPPGAARAGVTIALYDLGEHDGYGVVDDRRWIDVTGDALAIDHLDPRAALPSLVIEPLAGGAIEIGACLRDRIPPLPVAAGGDPAAAHPALELTPVLRCSVRGAPGRYLVRVLYVVPRLAYRAQHDVAMTAPDRATIASRFAIATPPWGVRAEVAVFAGAPGRDQAPREYARGAVMLDGGTAVLVAPPGTVRAQLRRIYDGAIQESAELNPRDPRWRRDSHPAVWVWLELADIALAPGALRVHVALDGEPPRDIEVPARGARPLGAALELPLWIDEALRGRRERWTAPPSDAIMTDRLALSIANTGALPREVWLEETLRQAQRRRVRRAWPGAPSLIKNLVRMKVTVAPGTIERAGFEIEYEL